MFSMFLQSSRFLLLFPLFVLGKGNPKLAVTGVKTYSQDGAVPLRQSISELQASGGPKWDLYIQALQAMYNKDNADPLSFFQIAGIHGKPFIEWAETGEQNSTGWRGYCPHGENLFLSWHRPFLLLFEQSLVDNAKQLADTYPPPYRQLYTKAAENLRAPYWDWGVEDFVPQAIVPKTVKIHIAGHKTIEEVEVSNPLYTYRFPVAALNGEYGSFDAKRTPRTYRCNGPNSYPDSANKNLASRPYKQWVYDAFTRSADFAGFGTTASHGMSVESIHNGIHWDAACGGQFLNAEFAGFDPLFMLHHCNVDRLWAYWQAIKLEDSTFQGEYQGASRFSTPGGTWISTASALQPFLQESGEFHTSETVNSIQGFGYTYQGLEYWRKSNEDMRLDATQIINNLYAPNDSKSQRKRHDLSMVGQTMSAAGRQHFRFFARISVELSELPERPCSIEVTFGGPRAAGMVAMVQPSEGLVHGTFSLDEAVRSASLHLHPVEQTVEALQSRLQVIIVHPDGTHTDATRVPSLKVDIEEVAFTPPRTHFELPTFSLPRLHLGFRGHNKGKKKP